MNDSERSSSTFEQGSPLYGFDVNNLDGNKINLGEKYAGKVLLVVNTASAWGKTRRDMSALKELHNDADLNNNYADQFAILALPSNSFFQERKNDAELKQWCEDEGYGFFMSSVVDVKRHPFFVWLKENTPGGGKISWNFHKFLIDKTGKPVRMEGGSKSPLQMKDDIIHLLEQWDTNGSCKPKSKL